MSEEHTKGRITFKADGAANHYSMLTSDGRWWLALLANGEQCTPTQIANMRRLAACWNACETIPTFMLEELTDKIGANLGDIVEQTAAQYLHIQSMQAERAHLQAQIDQFKVLSKANADALGEALTERNALMGALTKVLAITEDSRGVAGYHQNGNMAEWGEFEEVGAAYELVNTIKAGQQG